MTITEKRNVACEAARGRMIAQWDGEIVELRDPCPALLDDRDLYLGED
jgi:hypothetical protein